MCAPVLIGGVGGPVGIELLLQAAARLKQALCAIARDRAPFALALRFEPAAALAQPRPATLRARDELLRIKFDLDRLLDVVIAALRSLVTLAREALLGVAQRLPAALTGAQLLG